MKTFQPTRRAFVGALFAAPFALRYTPAYGAVDAPVKRFTIVHSNDPHGHLLPFSYPDVTPNPDQDLGRWDYYVNDRTDIGGTARIATLVHQIKRKEKNVIAIDVGDIIDGTPFTFEYFGKSDYEALSLVGFDYGTFGNHDFSMTVAQFNEMRARIAYPILLANVSHRGTGRLLEKPSEIRAWNGLRVAFFGLTTTLCRYYRATEEGFIVRDPLEVAKEIVPRLRAQADLVVLISHLGMDLDRQLAREVPGVDVIVGGHSHTRLQVGDYEALAKPAPGCPLGTVIVQAFQYGGELGRLDFAVQQSHDGVWRVVQFAAGLIPVNDRVKEHEQTKRVIAKYWEPIRGKYGEPIGSAAADFSEAKGHERVINHLLYDAALAGLPAIDFCIGSYFTVPPLPKGFLTRNDLLRWYGLSDTFFTYPITGANVRRILAELRPCPSANLRYTAKEFVHGNNKSEWRVTEATLNGEALQDDKIYHGASNAFYTIRSIKPYVSGYQDSNRLGWDLLVNYVMKNSPIAPKPDGRMRMEPLTS